MLRSKSSHMQLNGSNGSECGCKGEESTLLGCVWERELILGGVTYLSSCLVKLGRCAA